MSRILRSDARQPVPNSRRGFLRGAGQATLSATAVALIVGCQTRASDQMAAADPAADAEILNGAVGLEHQAIAAYQLGAESGLLTPGVVEVAVGFQSHHKEHRDALANAVRQLGGTPVEPKPMGEYAAALNAGSLQSQQDVLELAALLELEAANGYLSVIPSFSDSALSQVAGRIAADETMHWTVLAQALGRPLPSAALTFGA